MANRFVAREDGSVWVSNPSQTRANLGVTSKMLWDGVLNPGGNDLSILNAWNEKYKFFVMNIVLPGNGAPTPFACIPNGTFQFRAPSGYMTVTLYGNSLGTMGVAVNGEGGSLRRIYGVN